MIINVFTVLLAVLGLLTSVLSGLCQNNEIVSLILVILSGVMYLLAVSGVVLCFIDFEEK